MKYNFKIIKKDISLGLFDDDFDPLFDDPYADVVQMKCLKCGYFEDVEADILFECFNYRKQPYPILCCPHCNNGDFIPLDIFKQFNNKLDKDF